MYKNEQTLLSFPLSNYFKVTIFNIYGIRRDREKCLSNMGRFPQTYSVPN